MHPPLPFLNGPAKTSMTPNCSYKVFSLVSCETQKGSLQKKAHVRYVAGSDIGPQSACPKNSEEEEKKKKKQPVGQNTKKQHNSKNQFQLNVLWGVTH